MKIFKKFKKYLFKNKKNNINDLNKYIFNSMTPYIMEERKLNLTQIDVFSRLMVDRIIFIGTSINPKVSNLVQAQLLFLQSINDKKDIKIYINSPGGDIYSGLGIYDTMQIINPDISTICTGIAASMSALLLCSGTKGKRFCLNHSRVMIHQPFSGIDGSASDIEIKLKEINKLKNEIYQIISKHTGQKIKKIEKDSDRDYWMNSIEACNYGMIDKILKNKKKIK